MGTHAMIGHWDKETGKVAASYVHYDGYPEGVGKMLFAFYNNENRAKFVAEGGYLSSLEADHARSRAESVHKDGCDWFGSIKEYMKEAVQNYGAHYSYLWDGEAWFVAPRDEKFTDVVTYIKGIS